MASLNDCHNQADYAHVDPLLADLRTDESGELLRLCRAVVSNRKDFSVGDTNIPLRRDLSTHGARLSHHRVLGRDAWARSWDVREHGDVIQRLFFHLVFWEQMLDDVAQDRNDEAEVHQVRRGSLKGRGGCWVG